MGVARGRGEWGVRICNTGTIDFGRFSILDGWRCLRTYEFRWYMDGTRRNNSLRWKLGHDIGLEHCVLLLLEIPTPTCVALSLVELRIESTYQHRYIRLPPITSVTWSPR